MALEQNHIIDLEFVRSNFDNPESRDCTTCCAYKSGTKPCGSHTCDKTEDALRYNLSSKLGREVVESPEDTETIAKIKKLGWTHDGLRFKVTEEGFCGLLDVPHECPKKIIGATLEELFAKV